MLKKVIDRKKRNASSVLSDCWNTHKIHGEDFYQLHDQPALYIRVYTRNDCSCNKDVRMDV